MPTGTQLGVDNYTQLRWDEDWRRHTLCEGRWDHLVETGMRRAFGDERADVMRLASTSWNVGRHVVDEMAVLYSESPEGPTVVGPGGQAEPDLLGRYGLLQRSPLWAMADRHQRWTLTHWSSARHYKLRTYGNQVHLDVELVHPGFLSGQRSRVDPLRPGFLQRWAPLRKLNADPKDPRSIEWVACTYDLNGVFGPDPTYSIRDSKGDDVSDQYLTDDDGKPCGPMVGSAYTKWWSYSDGRPLIPYGITYRRMGSAELFPCEGWELWDLTVETAVRLSFSDHAFRNAAFPLRWIANATLRGVKRIERSRNNDGKQQAQEYTQWTPDPTRLMVLDSAEGDESTARPPIQTGEFGPGAEPLDMLKYIQQQATMGAEREGIAAADLQRTTGGGIASGYAISLSHEGQRKQQRRFTPSFKRSDEHDVGMVAAMHNRAHGTRWAERGYDVSYPAVALSIEELSSLRDQLDWELTKGFILEHQAMARLRGISDEAAEGIWRRNKQEQRRLQQAGLTPQLDLRHQMTNYPSNP